MRHTLNLSALLMAWLLTACGGAASTTTASSNPEGADRVTGEDASSGGNASSEAAAPDMQVEPNVSEQGASAASTASASEANTPVSATNTGESGFDPDANYCEIPEAERAVGMRCHNAMVIEGWLSTTPIFEVSSSDTNYLERRHPFSVDGPDQLASGSVRLLQDVSSLPSGRVVKVRMMQTMLEEIGETHHLIAIDQDVGPAAPTLIIPGEGMAEATLTQLTAHEQSNAPIPNRLAAPFRVSGNEMTVKLSDLASIQVGETVLPASASVRQVARLFGPCDSRQIAPGQGRSYICDGVRLTHSQDEIYITVTRSNRGDPEPCLVD